MPAPVNRSISEYAVFGKTASIGATPVAAKVVAPFRGKVVRTGVICEGAATGTIAVSVTVDGGSNIGALSVIGGDGNKGSDVPTGARGVTEGSTIVFTPSGGAGASIPGWFYAVIDRSLS